MLKINVSLNFFNNIEIFQKASYNKNRMLLFHEYFSNNSIGTGKIIVEEENKNDG